MITQEELKRYIEYDPETGLFTRVGFVDRWGNYKLKRNPITKLSAEGYLVLMICGKAYKAHRIAFLYQNGELPLASVQVDHINGNRGDNRFCNLRLVDKSTNLRNKKVYKNNSTGVLGVCMFGDKFRARLNTDDGRIELGVFSKLSDAEAAIVEHRRKCGYHENHGRKS